MEGEQRHALVFGGSGQIGMALLRRLQMQGWRIDALTRHVQAPMPSVHWIGGSFADMPGLPESVDAIFSCGPLDHFAAWYAQSGIRCPRVIAFGSTSLDTKRASHDDAERDLAARLQQAEQTVMATASSRGAHATLLRPTLVYGAGRDKTLTRIIEIAQRRGFFVLPSHATGLRQPVHVEDLADAAMQVIDTPATFGRGYALPGGETLGYREMVARTLRTLESAPRLYVLPPVLFRMALALARMAGMHGLNAAAVDRMQDDLAFDVEPARDDFGYAPRAFDPTVSKPASPPTA